MTIGQRITQLRKDWGISQGELARALEVSRQAVSKWEQDAATPDIKKLMELARYFDTDVQYLATGVPVEAPPPEVREKIVVQEVVRHVQRKPVPKNPMDDYLRLGIGFAAGLLVGLLF